MTMVGSDPKGGDRLMLSPLQGRDTKPCRLVRLAAVERGLNVPPPLPPLSPQGEKAFGHFPPQRLHYHNASTSSTSSTQRSSAAAFSCRLVQRFTFCAVKSAMS